MIVTAVTDAFRLAQLLDGAHRAAHEYRCALYRSDADLGPHTPWYEPAGEVRGQGYVPGGAALGGRRVSIVNGVAVLDWDAPVWDPATITAGGLLIYNASLPDLPAVLTYGFGRDVTSTNGPFAPRMPAQGLITWATLGIANG